MSVISIRSTSAPRLTGPEIKVLAERFWADVEPHPEDCWAWIGQRNHDGYGVVSRAGFGLNGGVWLAHRVSYFLANGYWAVPITRHLCHNRGCVHPGHLVQGTRQDNADDRKAMLAGIDLLAARR